MFFLCNYNACSPLSYSDAPPLPQFPLEISNPFCGEVWNIFWNYTMHYFILLWFLIFLYFDFQIHFIVQNIKFCEISNKNRVETNLYSLFPLSLLCRIFVKGYSTKPWSRHLQEVLVELQNCGHLHKSNDSAL